LTSFSELRTSRRLKKLALILLIGAALTARADYLVAHVEHVHDGDTITVSIKGQAEKAYRGRFVRIRLNGIDAPELKQPYGTESRDLLSAAIAGKDVMLITSKLDRYGRIIAKVVCDGVDENLLQISNGAAWFYRKYQRDVSENDRLSYAAAEVEAHGAKRGLWKNEEPEPPWTFRKNKVATP